jgi:multiple sugar transport system substrate-binding protein
MPARTLFWGLFSLPHLFPQKCVDVTDVADYLGKKYGGWVPTAVAYGKSGNKWIDIPICYGGNMTELPHLFVAEGGGSPNSRPRPTSSRIRQGDQTQQHARRHGTWSRHRRRQLLGALVTVAHGGNVVDAQRQGYPQLAGDRQRRSNTASKLFDNMIPGVAHGTTPSTTRLFSPARYHGPTTASRSTPPPSATPPRRRSPTTWTTRCGRSGRSASRPSFTSAIRSWR